MQWYSISQIMWIENLSILDWISVKKVIFYRMPYHPSHSWSYHQKLQSSELYQNRGWIMWTVAAAFSVYVTFQLVSYFTCILSLENQRPEVQHLVWGDARSVQLDFSKIQPQASSFFHVGKTPVPAPLISLILVLFLACSNAPYHTRHLTALGKRDLGESWLPESTTKLQITMQHQNVAIIKAHFIINCGEELVIPFLKSS